MCIPKTIERVRTLGVGFLRFNIEYLKINKEGLFSTFCNRFRLWQKKYVC